MYPWPTNTNCPLKNAEHAKKYRMGNRGADPSTSNDQETIDAVNSIAASADNTAMEEADQNTSPSDQNEPSSAPEGTSAAPGTSGAAGTSAEKRTKANTKPCDECGKDVQKTNYSRYVQA